MRWPLALIVGIAVCFIAMVIGNATGYQFASGLMAGCIAEMLFYEAVRA